MLTSLKIQAMILLEALFPKEKAFKINMDKLVSEAFDLVEFIQQHIDLCTATEKEFIERSAKQLSLNKGFYSEIKFNHLLKIRNRIMFGVSTKKEISEEDLKKLQEQKEVSEIENVISFLRSNYKSLQEKHIVFLKTLKNLSVSQYNLKTKKKILEIRASVL